MEQTIKFNTRQALLNSFLLGSKNQVTILTDDSERLQRFATYEDFIQVTELTTEAESLELQEKGYRNMFSFGGFYFLAKTVIRYTKRLTKGSALEGDIEPLQLHEDSWELDATLGEIRPDWQEMVKLYTQKF